MTIGLISPAGLRRRLRGRSFRSMNPVPIGVAFLVTMLLLVYLAFNLDKLPFRGGTTYTAAFSEAAGLRKGDKVRVAGVEVGQVKEVSLDGSHVRVRFTVTDHKVHLGTQTTASIQIFTLLGNKYLALEPHGAGSWPADRTFPLSRTTSPYDVVPAFQDVADTAARIDTTQLAQAFDTMATTFKDSPPAVRSMLSGLSRLSRTIASRDAELGALLQHANGFTGVLADRREQFARILGDGDQLLQMVHARRQVIAELLDNTTALSQQLSGLVRDNRAAVKPMLAHLKSVVDVLETNQGDLDESIKRLYVFVRGEVDATGSGPWFDGTAINATNPMQLGGSAQPPVSNTPARTLGELLRLPDAERAIRGGR